jgi:hypothetical protein
MPGSFEELFKFSQKVKKEKKLSSAASGHQDRTKKDANLKICIPYCYLYVIWNVN